VLEFVSACGVIKINSIFLSHVSYNCEFNHMNLIKYFNGKVKVSFYIFSK